MDTHSLLTCIHAHTHIPWRTSMLHPIVAEYSCSSCSIKGSWTNSSTTTTFPWCNGRSTPPQWSLPSHRTAPTDINWRCRSWPCEWKELLHDELLQQSPSLERWYRTDSAWQRWTSPIREHTITTPTLTCLNQGVCHVAPLCALSNLWRVLNLNMHGIYMQWTPPPKPQHAWNIHAVNSPHPTSPCFTDSDTWAVLFPPSFKGRLSRVLLVRGGFFSSILLPLVCFTIALSSVRSDLPLATRASGDGLEVWLERCFADWLCGGWWPLARLWSRSTKALPMGELPLETLEEEGSPLVLISSALLAPGSLLELSCAIFIKSWKLVEELVFFFDNDCLEEPVFWPGIEVEWECVLVFASLSCPLRSIPACLLSALLPTPPLALELCVVLFFPLLRGRWIESAEAVPLQMAGDLLLACTLWFFLTAPPVDGLFSAGAWGLDLSLLFDILVDGCGSCACGFAVWCEIGEGSVSVTACAPETEVKKKNWYKKICITDNYISWQHEKWRKSGTSYLFTSPSWICLC